LSDRESAICHSMIDHPTFRHEITVTPRFWRELVVLAKNRVGSNILRHFGRSLYWRSAGYSSWPCTPFERTGFFLRAVWVTMLSYM
jgi:hypothetical protein